MAIAVTDAGPVRTICMDRPAARNALNTPLLGELLDAVGAAVAAEAVRVVVLTGAGGHFSAGADIREPLDHAGTVRRMELFSAVYEAIGTSPKPVVAAVEGACVGGGAEVAAASDIRVVARSAGVRFPGAAVGVPVGAAKLVGLVGLGTAKDLVLTARTMPGDEALRVGFAQRLVDDGTALDHAAEVATAIAANHPQAVTHLLAAFDRYSGASDRINAENDGIEKLAQAGGDWTALTMRDPKKVGGWAAGSWVTRP